METDVKQDCLKRLNYIEGHIKGIRKMVEDDKYCADVLHQTHAVRKALKKMDALLLEGHLRNCVPAGVKEGRENEVLSELIDLYSLAEN